MNKLNSLVMSTLVASFLVGCGGGSSSSSTGTTTETTTVPVTKGTLINATAVDQKGKVGTQVMENGKYTNKYSFVGTIVYPITVTGGIVDADNSQTITVGDYAFTGKLSSYSNVVTPITTYLGNPADSTYQTKLEKLKNLTNSTEDDLVNKDPFELLGSNDKVFALSLSLYENYSSLMDKDDSNDDITEDDSALEIKVNEYISSITGTTNKEDIYIAFENKLKTATGVHEYTEAEADEEAILANFTFEKEYISGKQIYISDSEGTYTGKFYSDGRYSEVWNDTVSGGNSGTCTGTWKIDTNLIITSTCSDNKTPETNTIVFKKQPAAGVSLEVFINGVSDGVNTITSISNIDSTSTDTDSNSNTDNTSTNTDSSNTNNFYISLANDSMMFYFFDGMFFERSTDSLLLLDFGTYTLDQTTKRLSISYSTVNETVDMSYNNLAKDGVITESGNSFTINNVVTGFEKDENVFSDTYETTDYLTLEALYSSHYCTNSSDGFAIAAKSESFCIDDDGISLVKADTNSDGVIVGKIGTTVYGSAYKNIDGENFYLFDNYTLDSVNGSLGGINIVKEDMTVQSIPGTLSSATVNINHIELNPIQSQQ